MEEEPKKDFNKGMGDYEQPIKEERPLECSECKKEIKVHFAEVVGNQVTRTKMCTDCPHLEKHFYQKTEFKDQIFSQKSGSSLTCKGCGTSLESIRMGQPVGCKECYSIFDFSITEELVSLNPFLIEKSKDGAPPQKPLHIGRKLGEVKEVTPLSRLVALQEVLTDTLNKEDYEQAAWLRDQIKELSDKHPELQKGLLDSDSNSDKTKEEKGNDKKD